jgi:UV DNA damage endonuclease
MRIGYACLTVGVPATEIKSCRIKNADENRLYEITDNNLKSLEHMLEYNIDNDITLYRISSDIIPFGSSPVNTLQWWDIFERQFNKLSNIIYKHNIRVSMHPGQYTVLNSPNTEVVKRAVIDLDYHTRVLETLKTGADKKIILHIGGVYQDKEQAIKRFMLNYDKLEDRIKQRLVIENDDKSYNISDVLFISRNCRIPVVFDNLHHKVNPPELSMEDEYWINECRNTWQDKDGTQKIHYSQQEPGKLPGSHSSSINIDEFIKFFNKLGRDDLDIMLEVKDKNLSAVECIKKLYLLGIL